jgi:hypothetical protein
MNIIASGRKTSRTTRLIERCIELNAQGELCYIVCYSQEEAGRVFQKARELGQDIPLPISFEEFLGYNYSSRNIKHFLIDNADVLLQSLTGVHIDSAVVLKEPETGL